MTVTARAPRAADSIEATVEGSAEEAFEATHRSPDEYSGWQKLVSPYHHSDIRKSAWQVINSFGGCLLGLILMYFSLQVGYWLTLLLAFPTAGFVVRIFIIQHDCGHGSFYASRKWNDRVGPICSLFTLTAYKYWRKSHAVHHAHHAELEGRGTGDVWLLTVEEYLAAPRWKRILYRGFRSPLFLLGIAPAAQFLVTNRLPMNATDWNNGEKASVWWTNLALLLLYGGVGILIGFGPLAAIMLPVILIAATVGTWMFYVQHQFERTYWEHTQQWNYTLAAMAGSSYYKLPRVLQWFTGNIGFHHIHHLSPRIPNYRLEACHNENPILQRVTELNLRSSLKTASLALWDEKQQQLISFRAAIEGYKAATATNAS
jgi:omega-6 fatty acid desaturase (delta-12 desaturase)